MAYNRRSRLITADHARAVADTGGVVGVWPSSGTFHDLQGMAHGFRRMAEVVGVDHVGLGSDFDGAVTTGFDASQLVAVTQALVDRGFSQDEIRKVMGGNALRLIHAGLVPGP